MIFEPLYTTAPTGTSPKAAALSASSIARSIIAISVSVTSGWRLDCRRSRAMEQILRNVRERRSRQRAGLLEPRLPKREVVTVCAPLDRPSQIHYRFHADDG